MSLSTYFKLSFSLLNIPRVIKGWKIVTETSALWVRAVDEAILTNYSESLFLIEKIAKIRDLTSHDYLLKAYCYEEMENYDESSMFLAKALEKIKGDKLMSFDNKQYLYTYIRSSIYVIGETECLKMENVPIPVDFKLKKVSLRYKKVFGMKLP